MSESEKIKELVEEIEFWKSIAIEAMPVFEAAKASAIVLRDYERAAAYRNVVFNVLGALARSGDDPKRIFPHIFHVPEKPEEKP